ASAHFSSSYAERTDGNWTDFCVVRRERRSSSSLPTMSPTPAHDDKVNILLVDDQPNNILALESILADMGQNLVTANSGKKALKQLLDREFAVILLDVQM